MYLTYEEYAKHGGNLSEDDFSLAECRARKRIDYLTDCRVQRMAVVPEAVKLCIATLIRVDSKIGAEALADKSLLASYNTDGYSESYGSVTEQISVIQKRTDSMIRQMLYGELDDDGIPLLYRGVYL